MSMPSISRNDYMLIKAQGSSVEVQQARSYLARIKDRSIQYGYLIFDFSEVTDITPAALRTLTFATNLGNQSNAKVAIIGAAPISRAIAACGLEKILPCYPAFDLIFQ